MKADQSGCCAICELPPREGTRFHVDHDPRTGRVRALLCVKCNNGLGIFNEDPELLGIAALYLIRHAVDGRLALLKSA